MDYYEILKKLIGDIQPVGETNEDVKRLENLNNLIGVLEICIEDIEKVAQNKDSSQFSVKKAGEVAYTFRNQITAYEG